jgi:hypothetical protein
MGSSLQPVAGVRRRFDRRYGQEMAKSIAPAATTATATTAAIAALPASATTATAAARAFFTRTSNVYSQGPAIQAGAIHGSHGFLRFFIAAHGDEGKSAWPPCGAVHHEVGFHDGAVRGKGVLKIVFGCVEGKISDKQLIIHSMMLVSLEYAPASESVPDHRV